MTDHDTKKLIGRPMCEEHDYTDWFVYREGKKALIKRCKVCPKVMYVKEFFENKKANASKFKIPKVHAKVSHVELWQGV